eukprot:CAMPEP_0181195996 /NCGR_PEP_ID=MMETSP1096-20121128/15203_1 /TAXON_ID=156174 ORGANISM="Chrysochromulina ericina, Strain CCMP281" /NCGR_SAMPLE_ID=MMETSP1096 /ASSEMBLY_ACC=CAM_ASM_000453 /LENGTH=347 /DNA_ID=CAMNT_0023285673 /DNA_START=81 /DNA_END=1124 /DNA_ORIENTATION=+
MQEQWTKLQSFVEMPLKQVDRVNQYIDACICARGSKEVVAIKLELEKKDRAIERLEEEIRRKDSEKDNLMAMQRDLQAQISSIRMALETQASESEDRLRAATMLQSRVRGNVTRKSLRGDGGGGSGPVQDGVLATYTTQRAMSTAMLSAPQPSNNLTMSDQMPTRTPPPPPPPPAMGSPPVMGSPVRGEILESTAGSPAFNGGGRAAQDGAFFDDESIDSDYDYDDTAFSGLGKEVQSGKLKLAKVYGQDEPPAAEDELEWETRYFVLFDSHRLCHFDDLVDSAPLGDRGLVYLSNIKAVEKVAGVSTFVMKGDNKVYMFKLDPHDEAKMRSWIAAIQQELSRLAGV